MIPIKSVILYNIIRNIKLYRWIIFAATNNLFKFAALIRQFMATKEEVEHFLNTMSQKIKVFGIIFRNDRTKNQDTLLELEILPKYR